MNRIRGFHKLPSLSFGYLCDDADTPVYVVEFNIRFGLLKSRSHNINHVISGDYLSIGPVFSRSNKKNLPEDPAQGPVTVMKRKA